MSRTKSTDRRPLLRLFAALLVVIAAGCQPQSSEPTGGETHFLRLCHAKSDSCGGVFDCLCGVCTTPCSINTPCGSLPGAQCVTLNEACEEVVQVCDVECSADANCSSLSSAHHCIDGRCRLASAEFPHQGDGGANGESELCDGKRLVANEVVILGDSFFATTHEVTGYLEAMARKDVALLEGERFRDYSNLTSNTLAGPDLGIVGQYEAAREESEVGVVIMNGGGADVLLGSCEMVDAQCPAISGATQALEVLFSQMHADGVKQVVFVGYPDPLVDGILEKMSVLRPLLKQACDESTVPCAWLDLRPTFEPREVDFIAADGLNPTSLGAEASADVVWSVMQQQCIGR